MTQFFEGPTPSSGKGGGDSNYAAACGSLKENPPQCITVEYKLVNSKIKNVYGKQEKQRIAKFASQHGHEAAVRKFKKMSRPLLKVLSDLGSRDLKENLKEKFERKEESKQGSCSKDWSDT